MQSFVSFGYGPVFENSDADGHVPNYTENKLICSLNYSWS